jgi:hypothetical protein
LLASATPYFLTIESSRFLRDDPQFSYAEIKVVRWSWFCAGSIPGQREWVHRCDYKAARFQADDLLREII